MNYLQDLRICNICPHSCGVNRFLGEKGICGSGAGFHISSICIHKGEEPPISGINGICNIFFSRCNMRCRFCQNWQISRNHGPVKESEWSLFQVVEAIEACLQKGCHAVGFVSPSHMIPQVKMIIDELRNCGRAPVFVYNSNGYDKVEQLKDLESYIDVYLPDFKYMDAQLALKLSHVKDYPEVALAAIKEMYRQKGSVVLMDDKGQIEKGLIIRHLILPGYIQNSLDVLKAIAWELSASVAISLMSQYWPTPEVKNSGSLSRTLDDDEYDTVVQEFHRLGFIKGWVQDLDSHQNYRPDFRNARPFRD